MKKLVLNTLLLASLAALALTGCVYRERVVYRSPGGAPVASEETVVTEAPPPVIVERPVVAPGPGFVWIGGVWVWHGHWVWERGHWARPPRPGVVWVPHHYVYRNGVHVFIRGGWR